LFTAEHAASLYSPRDLPRAKSGLARILYGKLKNVPSNHFKPRVASGMIMGEDNKHDCGEPEDNGDVENIGTDDVS